MIYNETESNNFNRYSYDKLILITRTILFFNKPHLIRN